MAYVPNQPSPTKRADQESAYVPSERRGRRETPQEEKATASALTSGSSLEVIGGAAAIVLSVLGLANYYPFYMCTVATIVIGASLLAYGGAIASRWNDTVRRFSGATEEELAGGVGTEIVGGVAGAILGILSLSGVMPGTLLPVAAIVYGASLLLGGAVQPQIASLTADRDPKVERQERRSMQASAGVMVLVGVTSVVLGVLALIGVGPVLELTTIAMLVIGVALVLAGGASTVRFGRRMRQLA